MGQTGSQEPSRSRGKLRGRDATGQENTHWVPFCIANLAGDESILSFYFLLILGGKRLLKEVFNLENNLFCSFTVSPSCHPSMYFPQVSSHVFPPGGGASSFATILYVHNTWLSSLWASAWGILQTQRGGGCGGGVGRRRGDWITPAGPMWPGSWWGLSAHLRSGGCDICLSPHCGGGLRIRGGRGCFCKKILLLQEEKCC